MFFFLDGFGETCPNFILRAKRDAALSLARRVFEFFNDCRLNSTPQGVGAQTAEKQGIAETVVHVSKPCLLFEAA